MSNVIDTNDIFSTISTILAAAATMAAIFVIAFEFRSRRRKAERDRIVAVIEEKMPDRGNVSEATLADMEAFISTQLSQSPDARARLTRDLHQLAMLAIIDDRIIFQTASNLRAHISERRLTPEDRMRWAEFVVNWLRSNDQSDLLLPEKSDEARKNSEYKKKKRMLGAELEKAIA